MVVDASRSLYVATSLLSAGQYCTIVREFFNGGSLANAIRIVDLLLLPTYKTSRVSLEGPNDLNQPALEFMLSRRSVQAVSLTTPIPDTEQLKQLLEAAARVPDHGKLEPWRFIVLERSAMKRLAGKLVRRGDELGKAPSLVRKAAAVFAEANLIVAVVESPNHEAKIPLVEQTLSAGAVCLSLVNAALAAGWGATWLTGFGAHDPKFRESELALKKHERIAGFVHIGTARTQPAERTRPDIQSITTWMS